MRLRSSGACVPMEVDELDESVPGYTYRFGIPIKYGEETTRICDNIINGFAHVRGILLREMQDNSVSFGSLQDAVVVMQKRVGTCPDAVMTDVINMMTDTEYVFKLTCSYDDKMQIKYLITLYSKLLGDVLCINKYTYT